MIHQFLNERGEPAGHASDGWRHEIMRLHETLTAQEIWAGRSKTARRGNKIVRINEPHSDGRPSLTQGAIARWPHSVDLKFSPLGSQELRPWKKFDKFQIPAHWTVVKPTSETSGTKIGIIGYPFPKPKR